MIFLWVVLSRQDLLYLYSCQLFLLYYSCRRNTESFLFYTKFHQHLQHDDIVYCNKTLKVHDMDCCLYFYWMPISILSLPYLLLNLHRPFINKRTPYPWWCGCQNSIFQCNPSISLLNFVTLYPGCGKVYSRQLYYPPAIAVRGYSNSGCLSVRPSVSPSHFLVYAITWVNMDRFE
jgi:hypothetical protein